jgi:hypothetical protein
VTGPHGEETVWWAEHRANERGYNDSRVIACRGGQRPICVRMRVADID